MAGIRLGLIRNSGELDDSLPVTTCMLHIDALDFERKVCLHTIPSINAARAVYNVSQS